MNDQIQQEQTQQTSTAPVGQLKTNKSLVKFILLSLITFGIYGIVILSSVSNDINIIASRYDGKRTMHYCLLCFLVGKHHVRYRIYCLVSQNIQQNRSRT